MDSCSSLSFISRYLFISIVWISVSRAFPCTMGLNMLLIVPSTIVGKEHYTDTDGERSEHRVHVDGFKALSRDSLYTGGDVNQRSQSGYPFCHPAMLEQRGTHFHLQTSLNIWHAELLKSATNNSMAYQYLSLVSPYRASTRLVSLAIQYNGKLNLTSTRFVFFIHAKSSLYNRLLDIAKTAFQKQLTSKSTVF